MVPATWDEALKIVADRLSGIRDRFGPDSIGILTSAKGTNEENYLAQKLARAGLKTNNVDHVARLCHAPTVAGLGYAFGSGAMTNSISSLAKSDAILIIGSNVTEQHPLVASYILQARSRGAKLISADPRKTQIADLSDIHLATKIGTNIALVNCMLNVIIQKGLVKEEFIKNRTEGFEPVRDTVLKYTPEVVERITGVPAEMLMEAAIAYGSADRGSIVYAMGITQHSTGTDNVQALANLALATGNVGREGAGVYPLRGHQNVQGSCDMGALPDTYPGYQKVALSRQKFEDAWLADLPDRPGLTATEMIAAAEDGLIKSLFIIGENPMMSYPDRHRVERALEALDLLVVSDIFPTETTAKAHVILPAASFAEKEGTFTSTERRVQALRPALPPVGESRPEWQFLSELLTMVGVPASYSSPAEIMEEISSVTPIYGGVHYDRLGRDGLQWPCPDRDHPGTEIMHAQKFSSGLGRFKAVEHRGPIEMSDQEYPFMLTTGRSLYHFHTGTMTRRVSLLEREVPSPVVDVNPDDSVIIGIRNGQMVQIETRRGSVSAKARITAQVPQGVIFMPIHFEEAPANMLTGDALDPSSKIPEFKASAARIRRLP